MATNFLNPTNGTATGKQSQSNGPTARPSALRNTGATSGAQKVSSNTENDDESDDADSNSNNDGDDENDEDVFALSGTESFSDLNPEQTSLAGLLDDDMFASETSQTAAGAGTPDDDDNDYTGIEDLSDNEETGEGHEENIMLAAEQDLIDEFKRTEDRRNAHAMTNAVGGLFLEDDHAALARDLGLSYTGYAGDASSDWNFNINMNDDPFVGLAPGDSLYNDMYGEAERALGMGHDSIPDRPRQNSDFVTQFKHE
jgi:hypothetical protein